MADRRTQRGRPPKKAKKAKKAASQHPWAARLLRLLAVLSVVGGLLSLVGAAVLAEAYEQYVVLHPGPQLDRDHIQAVIAQESPVYYRDGTTRVGVFFEDEHRQYIPWDDLPTPYVMSIVAAEDGTFWTHHGMRPKHILRALLVDLRAGHVVAGGSTLTQQTAKNLFYRPDRSLKSKWTELVNALRLEAHFDKTEILTFYVNQFHVSGNGRGLGIAARYFFDEDVDDLSVVECAFLAGLVKAPSYYDPFLGDAARRAKSLKRAHDRTEYVLKRLVDEPVEHLAGPIPGHPNATRAERIAAAKKVKGEAYRLLKDGFTLDFQHGTFRYDSSAVLDEVGRRLQEPPFDEVLKKAGVDDPATAGLVVVTTLDPDVERESIYGLWHHLTELGAMLEGHTAADFLRTGDKGPRYAPEDVPKVHQFRTAKVTKAIDPTGQPHFEVDLGGNPCVVDRDAVVRAALWSWRGEKKDRYTKVPTAQVNKFAGEIPVGGVVWVSVREVHPDGSAVCDLELRPELQGAAMVVRDGEVLSMVGGNDNRNFNRATALRQMGSTWKPLIYNAAIKLGRSPLDELDNTRGVFPFSTTFYYPSPDHPPPPVVTMAWAGVHSENLASIWLLYHLTDGLNAEQVRVLAESLGMARRADESPTEYRTRIQKMGILPTPSRIEEGFFLQARQEVLSGLALGGHPEDALPLRSLLYGWGFDAERRRVQGESAAGRAWKLEALDDSWRHLHDLMDPCSRQYEVLAADLRQATVPPAALVPDLSLMIDGDTLRVACGAVPDGYVRPADALEDLSGPIRTAGTKPPPKPSRGLWNTLFGHDTPTPPPPSALQLASEQDMLVDDRLHESTLEALEASMRRRRTARVAMGDTAPGLYDPEVLYWHQDFRVLLGMRYVTALAGEYGVRTDLDEVLSLPLGASEITLEEGLAVYQGLATGKAWEFPGTGQGARFASPDTPTLLIKEIRDVDGNVLYEADPTPKQVTPPEIAGMTTDILRNVVRYGTGRRAARLLQVNGAYVPLVGKTGTTNDFRNAVFLGYVPHADGTAYTIADGAIVGVYVGYDDNTSMARGRIHIEGASGALPAWNYIVQGIADDGLLGEGTGTPTTPWWPLEHPSDLLESPVDAKTGMPLDPMAPPPEDTATVLTRVPEPQPFASLDLDVRPSRFPHREAPSTVDAQRLQELRQKQRAERARKRPSVWDAP